MKRLFPGILFLLLGQCPTLDLSAQTTDAELVKLIYEKDSLFWVVYNNCDTSRLSDFFTEDMEFYHDKGGATVGFASFAATMKKNLCSNPDFRLRREAVAGSVKVYPLHNGAAIYGAIISGDHLFYIRETGKKERLDGLAKFSQLWLLKNGKWKMSRILSYDHGPAPASMK